MSRITFSSRSRPKSLTAVCLSSRSGLLRWSIDLSLTRDVVGGIYSVIKSKAHVTTNEYGDRYTLIGPLNHQSVRFFPASFRRCEPLLTISQAAVEVEELEPSTPELAASINAMKERGIGILYGRWLIEGAPRVLLIDTKTAYHYMDEWKADLWNVASIPSPASDDETNEAIVFGYLVAWFLGEVGKPSSHSALVLLPSGGALVLLAVGASLTAYLVRLPREEEGGHRPLPRVAGRRRSSADQEAPHGRDDHLHDPRHSPRQVPVRRLRRLLQQPPVVRCGLRGRQARHLPPILHRAGCCPLVRRLHDRVPHHGLRERAPAEAQARRRAAQRAQRHKVLGHARVPESAPTVQGEDSRFRPRPLLRALRLRPRKHAVPLHGWSLRVPEQGRRHVHRVARALEPPAQGSGEQDDGRGLHHHARPDVVSHRGGAQGPGRDKGAAGHGRYHRAVHRPSRLRAVAEVARRRPDARREGAHHEPGPRAPPAAPLRHEAPRAAAQRHAQHGERPRRPDPEPDPPRAAVQPPERPGQDRVPPGIPELGQPRAAHGLRRLRARHASGRVRVVLRAVWLYARRVHRHGGAEHHDQSVRVRVLHGGAHRELERLRHLHRRPAQLGRGRLGQPADVVHVRVYAEKP